MRFSKLRLFISPSCYFANAQGVMSKLSAFKRCPEFICMVEISLNPFRQVIGMRQVISLVPIALSICEDKVVAKIDWIP